jgi:L-ascorbate oxidase
MRKKSLSKQLNTGVLTAAAFGSALLAVAASAFAATPRPLQDPPVFASQGGTLSLLMVAAARHAVPLGPVTSDLWTYEVCNLPAPGANACPPGKGQSGLGGVRLQLQPGDKLRVRLVNNLPVVTDSDHASENPSLANNPTSFHTHGLIVEPHRAVGPTDTYGDYVFLELTNPANPPVGAASHPGLDIAEGVVQYQISIDATHPPGLYWFHPHLHGLSLNQVTAGMAGIITIGSVADECGDAACVSAVQQSAVRHIVLKDTQVGKGNALISQTRAFATALHPRRGKAPARARVRLPGAPGCTPSTVRFTRRSPSADRVRSGAF